MRKTGQWAIVVLVLFTAPLGAQQTPWPPNLSVSPQNPRISDVITLTFSDTWSTDCIPVVVSSSQVRGQAIYVTLNQPYYLVCNKVTKSWQLACSVGPLAAGCYDVYVELGGSGSAPSTKVTTFCVGSGGQTTALLVDSDFNASSDSAALRANAAGQDWYESRENVPTLLTLDLANVGGNATKKAKLTASAVGSAYLTQEFSSSQSQSFTAQWDIYVDSIWDRPNSIYDCGAWMFIGDDTGTTADRIGPNAEDSERFVYLAFYKAGGGSSGTMDLIARERSDPTVPFTTVATGLSLKRWYTIKVICDVAQDTYDVYIDGQLQGTVEARTTKTSLTHITFAEWAQDEGTATFYVDNVTAESSAASEGNCLVAHWPLDETTGTIANDSAGNYDGVLYNGPVWQPTGGKIGGALRFDGVNDYVALPIGPLISALHECTFAIWVNVSDSGWWQYIFSFGTGWDNRICLSPNAGGTMRAEIEHSTSDGLFQWTIAESPNGPLPSGWHHLAMVVDSDKVIHLYVDGILNVSSNPTYSFLFPSDLGQTTQNWLGRYQSASSNYFNGSLDDFRIYNCALTAAQIQDLASGGTSGDGSGSCQEGTLDLCVDLPTGGCAIPDLGECCRSCTCGYTPAAELEALASTASCAPAGAVVTAVDYDVLVQGTSMYCNDYEISISNDQGSRSQVVFSHQGGTTTDMGADDDPELDRDIDLQGRTTQAFDGISPQGNWKLCVRDTVSGHTGSLMRFCIHVHWQLCSGGGGGTGACCGLKPGDRVVLLVNSLRNAAGQPAVGLSAGALGTVVCCDYTDPVYPLFISWDDWSNGDNGDTWCSTKPGYYPPYSGWWVQCTDVGPCPGGCGPSTPPFDGCGLLIAVSESCLLFQADDGGVYYLDSLGGFKAGTRVHIQGRITPCSCTYCGRQVNGTMVVTVIVLCGGCTADFCQYEPYNVGFSPSSIQAGQSFHMNFGIANCGTTSIPSGWKIRYYASTDTTITASDHFLWESVANFGIAAGQQMAVTEDFVWPSGVPAGQYYLGWILDPENKICESNENNNAGYIHGVRLTVGNQPR